MHPAPPQNDPHPHTPRFGPWAWGILALGLGLQLTTLARIEGYLLADSVEYMDRAQQVARGLQLDPNTVRSFAFSALLTPIFWLTDLFGLPGNIAVGLCRGLVMVLGLGTLALVMRLGTRLFGSPAGHLAGFALAVNPAFLQFGVEPLSGMAATFAVTMALCSALGETPDGRLWRRGLKCGAWLGVALLMAFKTIPIGAALILFLFYTGPWKQRALWGSATLAFSLFGLAQCLLDRAIYGRFGGSLLSYLAENIGGLLAGLLLKLHEFGIPGTYDLAVTIYQAAGSAPTGAVPAAENIGGVVRSATERSWYIEHLTADFLVWPLAIALVLGLAVSLFQSIRKSTAAGTRAGLLLGAVLLVNFGLLSFKSSKSFRLLLPLLPFIALLTGLGFARSLQVISHKAGQPLGRLAAGALLIWALLGSQAALAKANLTKYGGWWQATEQLENLATEYGETWRFASAYSWAVALRARGALELHKLPHPMHRWPELTQDQREAVLSVLEGLDAFIAHRQILTQDPGALGRINARFEIHDILYDAHTFEELGPLYVLVKRQPGAEPRRSFFELHKDSEPGSYQARIQQPRKVDYRRRQADGPDLQLTLLGWDLETGLADGQLAWFTMHWYAGNLEGHDYTVATRITDRDNRSLQGNHKLAESTWSTTKLEPGWILAESMPIIMPLDPLVFGGADARGDLLPVQLWVNVMELDQGPGGDVIDIGGLNPFHPSGQAPIRRPQAGQAPSSEGYHWSPDAQFQVGGLWLPVPGAMALADDGHSVPEPAQIREQTAKE